jgi:hypothetical protein
MPEPTASAEQRVETSTLLWSELCARADPTPEDRTAYIWGNGKKFKEGQGVYDTPPES